LHPEIFGEQCAQKERLSEDLRRAEYIRFGDCHFLVSINIPGAFAGVTVGIYESAHIL
jgi:hypothetical protein